MKLTWADNLSVGNALIDSEHKNLISVINRMDESIKDGDRIALSIAFELFDTYMHIHTLNEEKIAEAVNYPFSSDKLAQQQSMDEMGYMINKLEHTYGVWPDNIVSMYSRFLADWMSEHITRINMQMKPALQTFAYDFIPGKGSNSFKTQTAMVLPIKSYFDFGAPA